MGFSRQAGQLFLLLFLAIVVYALLYQSPAQVNQQYSRDPQTEKPAAYLKGARFFIYNKEGTVSTQLNSDQAFYFHDSDSISIQSPQVTINASEGRKINLTANEGIFFPGDERLNLKGSVNIEQSSPEIDSWQLNTEELKLNSAARFISTDQAVTIHRGSNSIQAIGLNAWLDEKKIDLLSKVRGRYVYQQTSP